MSSGLCVLHLLTKHRADIALRAEDDGQQRAKATVDVGYYT